MRRNPGKTRMSIPRVALLAPLLVVAACGGGDGDGDRADTVAVATETTRVTVTGTAKTETVVRTVTQVVTVRQAPRPQQTAPVTTVRVPERTADPRATPTGNPRFRVVLTGEAHEAEPGRRWTYVVRATSRGKAAGGTAKMRVYADGVLVDTIGFFAFRGELRRTHVWPRSVSGKRVVLQAEVEGAGGTQRANWPVTIR